MLGGCPLYFYVNNVPNINKFGAAKWPNIKFRGLREGVCCDGFLEIAYHSGQNYYIHRFLFWAVISEYVKIAFLTFLADLFLNV